MRKLLLNPTPLFRKLRQLSLLLTLLLVSLGALGQNSIKVANTTIYDSGVITGDDISGTVSIDFQANTLTLTDATINGDIIWDSTGGDDLTIEMSGKNSIIGIKSNNATATCSLHVKKISTAESATLKYTGNFDGFILDLQADLQASFNPINITDGNTTYYYYTTKEVYNLAVSNIEVHNIEGELGYKENIFNDNGTPTASFDGTNTLTLNGATLTKFIHWGADADLTIELKGTNSMNTNSYCIESEHSKKITFTGGGENCSLELSTVTDDDLFSGFSNSGTPSMGTGMYWIPTWNNGEMTSALITNSILGGGKGTEVSPFIISTFEHLKTFAKYVNDGILSTEYIKLGGSIDCTNQTGFEPIGNNTNTFIGTFDGGDNSITGLIFSATNPDGVAGLFGNIGSYNSNNDVITRGTVKNLTLNGCQFGNGARNGAIAGNLDYGTIEKCTVTSCTISSGNSQSTFSGGITGMVNNGVVKDCVVNGGEINSSTTSSGGDVYAGGIVASASGRSEINGCTVSDVSINSTGYNQNSYSGGIVGYSEATISGNSVEGTTTVNNINNDNNAFTGAIGAYIAEGSLTNNYYYYTVKTKTTIGSNDPVEKSDYTQRALGNGDDISANNGAVMYTKTLTVGVSSEGFFYYEPLSDNSNGSFAIAPGQTVGIELSPGDGMIITAASLVYTPTGGTEQTVALDNVADPGYYGYSFTMPDANATLNATLAQTYDLWIGDTQVTSANAAHILGESNTTVVFTVADPKDGSPNTLTLNGATLTVPVKVGLANLTIDIQGTNTITVPDGNVIKKPSTTTTGLDLTLKTSTADGKLTLTSTSNETIEPGGVFSNGFNINIDKSIGLIQPTNSYNLTNGSAEYHVVRFAPSLGVSIGDGYGGTIVITDDNATDVLGDGKVIFKKNSKTLTLNGATLSGAISTSLSELNIDLVGKNSIITYSDGHVIETPYNDDATVNIKSTAQEKGGLTMTLYYSNDGRMVSDHVNLVTAEPLTILSGSLTGNDGNNNSVIIGEDYKLDVAGTKVTYLNKDNILGDTEISVTFTPSSNTLNLNGATINGDGGIYYNGTTPLIFALNGANSIINTGGTYAIGASTYTDGLLKFEKATGASNAELTLTWGSGSVAISASNPTLGSGLYWKPIAATTMVITDDPEFVIVDGYVITDAASVAGDEGEVRYDSSNKILTLDGYSKAHATGKHAIKTGVTNLKVKLIGESTISCISDSAIFHAFYNSASIQFVKNDATSKLTMTGTAFDNFAADNVTYDGLVYYSENNYIAVPTAPTMAEDNNKVKLTINYSGGNIAIKYSIDYADGKTTGVTGATYSEPFAMTAPGTVEAWVEANGATTENDKVKGKYFGFKDAPFTLKADLVDHSKSETLMPVMIPAFVDGENINITTATTPYLSSATDVATFTDGTITAVGIGTATVTANIDYTADVHPVVILNPDKKVTAEVKVGVIPAITFVDDRTYATFCNTGDKDLTVPDGLTAYAVTGVNGTVVTLAEVNFLPKVNGTDYVALLLKREDPSTTVGIAEEFTGGTRPTSNQLKYAISDVPTTGVEFVLYKDEFVKATGSIPANKCYLDLNGVSFTRGAYGIGDGTTAIDATLIDNEETNDNWYDLQGRRIQQPSKAGLYIKNGKKVIVNTK